MDDTINLMQSSEESTHSTFSRWPIGVLDIGYHEYFKRKSHITEYID